jgi:hypothetical protein
MSVIVVCPLFYLVQSHPETHRSDGALRAAIALSGQALLPEVVEYVLDHRLVTGQLHEFLSDLRLAHLRVLLDDDPLAQAVVFVGLASGESN